MGLKSLTEKLTDYQRRLEAGKAHKIEPAHVRKVLDKLRRKEAELRDRRASEERPRKRAEIEGKLDVARQHIERAEWLLDNLP